MKHVSLDDDNVSYEALPYMWGSSRPFTTIKLDNFAKFKVPYNLGAALQDLRLQHDIRAIWIDAICINQHDKEDKDRQLKLMKRIYRQAKKVRVWLAPQINISLAAFQHLAGLSENSTIADLHIGSMDWAPVVPLVFDEYWLRVWIQQEVALAQTVTFQCAGEPSYVVSEVALGNFVRLIGELTVFHLRNGVHASFGALLSGSPIMHVPRMLHGHIVSLGGYQLPFGDILDCLRRSRSLHATEPRDHVYGILGIVD